MSERIPGFSTLAIHAGAQRSHVRVRLFYRAFSGSRFLERHHQPVFANGKSDPRRRRAAERLGKSVIAAAAENRILRPQSPVSELKRSSTVIIQAADQAVVELKLNPDCSQYLLHLLEMPAARLVEKLADARQRFDNRLICGNFAIEDPKWIGDGATLAVGAHLSDDRFERLTQSFVVGGTIVGATDRV